MGERLPVNIFSGMLPTGYVFLDTGDDDSKWVNVATGHPIETSSAFDSLGVGDAYGYFGKGMRCTITRSALASTRATYRMYCVPPTIKMFFGATIRPNWYCYPIPGRNRRVTISLLIVAPLTTGQLASFKLQIQTLYMDVFGVGVMGQANLYVAGATTQFCSTVSTASGLMSPPWLRIGCFFDGAKIRMATMNGQQTSVDITPTIIDQYVPPMKGDINSIALLCQKFAVDPLDDQTIDVDQIWVSDNENIV